MNKKIKLVVFFIFMVFLGCKSKDFALLDITYNDETCLEQTRFLTAETNHVLKAVNKNDGKTITITEITSNSSDIIVSDQNGIPLLNESTKEIVLNSAESVDIYVRITSLQDKKAEIKLKYFIDNEKKIYEAKAFIKQLKETTIVNPELTEVSVPVIYDAVVDTPLSRLDFFLIEQNAVETRNFRVANSGKKSSIIITKISAITEIDSESNYSDIKINDIAPNQKIDPTKAFSFSVKWTKNTADSTIEPKLMVKYRIGDETDEKIIYVDFFTYKQGNDIDLSFYKYDTKAPVATLGNSVNYAEDKKITYVNVTDAKYNDEFCIGSNEGTKIIYEIAVGEATLKLFSSTSLQYSTPFSFDNGLPVDTNIKIKAVAIKDNFISEVKEINFTLPTIAPDNLKIAGITANEKVIVSEGKELSLTATNGTDFKIYWTIDGSDPTINSNLYTGKISPLMLGADGNKTIKAKAINGVGSKSSNVQSLSFVMKLKPSIPTIMNTEIKDFSTNFTVSAHLDDRDNYAKIIPGTKFHYTLDGTEPTIDSPTCTEDQNRRYIPVSAFKEDGAKTVKVIAARNGYTTASTSANCNVLLTPTFLGITQGELVSEEKNIEIKTGSYWDRVKIHYTVDGSEPTETVSSTTLEYNPANKIKTTDLPGYGQKTLKAIMLPKTATDGVGKSAVATLSFTKVLKASQPTFGGVAQNETVYLNSKAISINAFGEGTKVIYYTIDGSTPTTASRQYSSPISMTDFGADGNKTIKAISTINGVQSTVSTLDFTLKLNPSQPTINTLVSNITYYESINFTITTPDADTEIYYTIGGATPTSSSTRYTAAIALHSLGEDGPKKINAIAYRNGKSSAVVSKEIILQLRPAAPNIVITNNAGGTETINPTSQGYYSTKHYLRIISNIDGRTIYFTKDGSDPKTNGVEFNATAMYLSGIGTGEKTIKAVVKKNEKFSDVSEKKIKIAVPPPAPSFSTHETSMYSSFSRGYVQIDNIPANCKVEYQSGERAYQSYTKRINIKSLVPGRNALNAKVTDNTTGLETVKNDFITFVEKPTNMSRWLDSVDNSVMISQLNIPGTHESGAYQNPSFSFGYAQCQSEAYAKQFSVGVRVLDSRIHQNMAIYHGAFYMGHAFGNVTEAIQKFLNDNPSEFVILSIKDENGSGGEQNWTNQVLPIMNNTGKTYTRGSGDYSVGELRGKFIIIRRYGYIYDKGITPQGWGDNSTSEYPSGNPPIFIQDRYNQPDLNKGGLASKQNAVIYLLNKAQNDKHDNGGIYINFLSATGNTNPGYWASSMNNWFSGKLSDDYHQTTENIRYGIIMIDFVNRTPEIASKIVGINNFKLYNEVK